VKYSSPTATAIFDQGFSQWRLVLAILVLGLAQIALFAQAPPPAAAIDEKTTVIDDAPDMEVLSFGKSVIVKKRAKSAFAFGGDVTIEGQVEGDVAVLGGSLIQKENASIGGDVIVIGGSYRPEGQNPLRGEGKQTVMFGMFEEEIRELAARPSQIFSPTFSLAFLAQRLISVLFWFIVSLGLTTLAPGAVGRAITRFQLSTTKVVALGFSAFMITLVSVLLSLSYLPGYINAIFGLMVFVLMSLAYVFGRVTLQVSAGKLIQKYFFSEKNRSETLAILIGVVFWTILLSLPYLWMFGVFALFWAGIGLVLTARSSNGWSKA
jgi:hypothetical protein